MKLVQKVYLIGKMLIGGNFSVPVKLYLLTMFMTTDN